MRRLGSSPSRREGIRSIPYLELSFRLTDYFARITIRGSSPSRLEIGHYHDDGYPRNDATAASLRHGEITEVLLRRPGVRDRANGHEHNSAKLQLGLA